jgi:hypothetical protein
MRCSTGNEKFVPLSGVRKRVFLPMLRWFLVSLGFVFQLKNIQRCFERKRKQDLDSIL